MRESSLVLSRGFREAGWEGFPADRIFRRKVKEQER